MKVMSETLRATRRVHPVICQIRQSCHLLTGIIVVPILIATSSRHCLHRTGEPTIPGAAKGCYSHEKTLPTAHSDFTRRNRTCLTRSLERSPIHQIVQSPKMTMTGGLCIEVSSKIHFGFNGGVMTWN